MLSSLEPGQAWGLATAAAEDANGGALVRELLEQHRISLGAVVSQGQPGPVFPFSGVRVTPQIYTRLDEIDRFVAVMRQLL